MWLLGERSVAGWDAPCPPAQLEHLALFWLGGQGLWGREGGADTQGGTLSPACCDEPEPKQDFGNGRAGVGVKRLRK